MFDNLLDILHKVSDLLQDVNSIFPETQNFLRSKGLTHVSQLDEQGLKDLQKYLQMILIRDATFKSNGVSDLNDTNNLFE